MRPERQIAGLLSAQSWGSNIPPRCVSTATSLGDCPTLVLTIPAKTDQRLDYSLESAAARVEAKSPLLAGPILGMRW